MFRRATECPGFSRLDDAAHIHHEDAAANVFHHRENVGDKEIGDAVPALKILEQVDGLVQNGTNFSSFPCEAACPGDVRALHTWHDPCRRLLEKVLLKKQDGSVELEISIGLFGESVAFVPG